MRPCTDDRRGDYNKGIGVAKDGLLAYNVPDLKEPAQPARALRRGS